MVEERLDPDLEIEVLLGVALCDTLVISLGYLEIPCSLEILDYTLCHYILLVPL